VGYDYHLMTELKPIPGKNIAIRVSKQAEGMIRKNHPWVFDQAITYQSHAGNIGDLAVIFDSKRNFLAVGLFDPGSVIRIRVLEYGKPVEINKDWLVQKIQLAADKRGVFSSQNTSGYRLVFGENDGLPGLVIDRYADVFVIKIYTAAWFPYLSWLIESLKYLHQFESLVLRLSRNITQIAKDKFGLNDGVLLAGERINKPTLFAENGLIFEADPINGHKTGFYLDQRENRARVEALSAGKAVLNMFSYNGGFSLYAARGGAKSIISVDLNPLALESAARNFSYNQNYPAIKTCQNEMVAEDAFKYLAALEQNKRKFDLVILDPPMFAHKQNQVPQAIANYQKLTQLGLAVLNTGGILVQASCSSRVNPPSFFNAIHSAVQRSGQKIREIERSGHPIDHPIGFPEGEYLKCLFAIID